MSHTPGPWQAVRSLDGKIRYIAETHWGPLMAIEFAHSYYRDVPEEAEANARLIAAAPELLAVLEKLEWIPQEEGMRCPSCGGWKSSGVHLPACALQAALVKAKEVAVK